MTNVRVDLYERIWMWGAAGIITLFLATLAYGAAVQGLRPPSHVETINPETVREDARFATPGVITNSDGSVTVTGLAFTFAFDLGEELRVPARRRVTFRLTSPDVTHGFQVVGTNANVMVVPGYVTQFTTVFPKAGEYLIVCNEFCGVAHHMMSGKLIVEDTP